ncbi:MAG: YetF domain-containing protein [Phormidesmis sp.]
MQSFYTSVGDWLGLNASDLSISQMCLRAVVIYAVALLMVRIVGDRRFAGKYAAVDIVLSIMLGATLSRAINGSASFFPTILASLVLVALHWLLAALSARFPALENRIKGRPQTLVQDGQIKRGAFEKAHITEQDLKTTMRSQGSPTTLDQVASAVLEPNGSISIIPRSLSKVVDVSVEEGTKTVRILID